MVNGILDAGFTGGIIKIKGALENKENNIVVRDMNIETCGYIKSIIENNLSNIALALKKYFENKYRKSFSKIKITGSGLEVYFE